MPTPLDGLKILVVEDEFLVAMDLSRMIRNLGGEVLGPVSTLTTATELLQAADLDGAIVDLKLGKISSLPLVEELQARGVPVVLSTGYATEMLPENLAEIPQLSKPYSKASFREIVIHHFSRR
jgi:two-component SAPR family response regulator